ncbi:hypothetical protein HM1_1692 [Heliomicrobium modesticaldum Ice1]|uniref:Plasmid pRiA4b Orf3-like domain-containing protein n=1 Tax=Heliobacterium modesticaldum (strain ATCC 51547 / Ice1) TaxID=498761 RepID=B0TE67_HELMI|nr:hypothetical protein [Heliomicrobium modesticaldum]ABZ84262.1 hypothetical protein HM1_1692 [Heliomicrobium modesticaldum Ice1]
MSQSNILFLNRKREPQEGNTGQTFIGAYAQREIRWFHSAFRFRAAWQGRGKSLTVCLGQLSFNPADASFLIWQEMSRQEWQWESGVNHEVPVSRDELGQAVQSLIRHWQAIDGSRDNLTVVGEQWPELGRLIGSLQPLPALSAEQSRRLLHKLRPRGMSQEDTIFTWLHAWQNYDYELEGALRGPLGPPDGLPWWRALEARLLEADLPVSEPLAPWHIHARMRRRMAQRKDSDKGRRSDLQGGSGAVDFLAEDLLNVALISPWKSEHVHLSRLSERAPRPGHGEGTCRYSVRWLKSSVIEKPLILDILGHPCVESQLEITLYQVGMHWWVQTVWASEPHSLTMAEKLRRLREPFWYRVYDVRRNLLRVTGYLDGSDELFTPLLRVNDYWEERPSHWKSLLDEGQDRRCSFFLIGGELVILGKDESRMHLWERRLFNRASPPTEQGQLPLWLYPAFSERLRSVDGHSFDDWRRGLVKAMSVLNPEILGLPEEWRQALQDPPAPEVYWSQVLRAWSEWLDGGERTDLAQAIVLLGNRMGASPELLLRPNSLARGLLLEYLAMALPSDRHPPGLRHEPDLLHPRLAEVLRNWRDQPFGLYKVLEWRAESCCRLRDLLRDQEQELPLHSYFEPPEAGRSFFARLLPLGDRCCLLGCLEVDDRFVKPLREHFDRRRKERELSWDAYLADAGWRALGEVARLLGRLLAIAAAGRAGDPVAGAISYSAGSSIYRFRVKQKGAPGLSRDVEVAGEQTLHQLHEIIQQAFDWKDDRRYAFYLNNRLFDKAAEFGGPRTGSAAQANKAQLIRLNLRSRQKFAYLFDFDNEHIFEIRVRDIVPPEPGVLYPRVVEKKRPFVLADAGVDDQAEGDEDA